MVFQNLCVLVLWTIVALALEGLGVCPGIKTQNLEELLRNGRIISIVNILAFVCP